MPTRYFKNSVDQYWYTTRNWWANAACDEGFSGTLTGVNVTDTSTTVTCDSTFGLVVGRPITGTGIDTGTTVASITNSTEFELSQAAIADGTDDLTCEKHENPATGDDVVIATGNGTVVGAPGYDVLGLVTVNGDTVLDLDGAINAANIEFNDTSSITDGGLTGTCVFNDSSFASIASSFSPITGNCTFNDSSYCAAYITGNCTFNNTSSNGGNSGGRSGYITGDCTFNDTSQNLAGTLTGTVTFNDSSYNGQYGYISGSAIFNDTSYNNASSGEITGNVSFNDSSYNNSATVTVTGTLVFNDTSHNEAGFTANGTVNDSSYNHGAGGTGNWVFNNTSYNDDVIFGDVTYNDSSRNAANGAIWGGGTATFNDLSYSEGGWGIDAAIVRQSAAAFVAWRNYATSTYITTLHLQFPEMDILGTGLL